MIYQSFHQKYRPQTFAELVGQDAIAQTLTHAIQQSRIAPAYLFCGSRGTGKTSSARILSKSLNCLRFDRPTPNPCGICEACQAIAQGNALDVIEIDAASHTGVENVRNLIERAQFAPIQLRMKIFVLDEAHMLSTSATSALLKTLEEPPERVVFILATTEPHSLLPTIISRCQRYDFRRIKLEPMVKHLSAISTQEQMTISDTALHLIARLSQGGLRDAETLLEQLSILGQSISTEQVWENVGAVPGEQLIHLVESLLFPKEHSIETLLVQIQQLLDQGQEPTAIVQGLLRLLKDLQIAQTLPDCFDLATVQPEIWQHLAQMNSINGSRLAQMRSHLREAEAQLSQTSQPALYLECLMLDLVTKATSVAPEQPNIPLDLVTTWQSALDKLSGNHRPIFRQAQLVQCTSNSATIRFRAASFLNLATNYQSSIEQALSQVLGYQVSVRLCV
ncbi:DNA polymerase III subunit gamma/tau [Leptolyngbya sp. NIES-2104]|uniref:DNA polymerase III subunit gamma/tau n=1 Tax=Leptolyngbya sp. NIES-2104 TaxID=1552121 RepID=UPI0006EC4D0E|nr:DNA polymerase III subunit gamma/tau [Leptolyngbya sp. NIES-2104]GAP99751.1 DNA polymerase III subunits gamma and tau [Leptolyngbya sp. NIES-2104]